MSDGNIWNGFGIDVVRLLAGCSGGVVAALTILRAHAAAGKPTCGVRPWGSFESFAHRIASAIAFVGLPNPLVWRLDGSTAAT